MAVEVRLLPGRGRGLVTTNLIKAGDAILIEQPILLTVAQEFKDTACAHCLRLLGGASGCACTICQQVAFCSPACQQAAAGAPWVHAPGTCRALTALAHVGGDLEAAAALRFLIQAMALRALAASIGDPRYQQLLELQGEPDEGSTTRAAALQPLLCDALGSSSVSPQEVAALLAKEQLNSYGIMAPLRPRGERRLRGGAIYPRCAMVNHECAPNAARFDAFDQAFDQQQQMQQAGALGAAAAAACTAAQIRAMHDLPPGTEVTISYVPLNWDLEARQEHLQQVYGFSCCCPRCKTEASDEWAAAAGAPGDAGSSGDWETESGDDEEWEEEEEAASDDHMADAGTGAAVNGVSGGGAGAGGASAGGQASSSGGAGGQPGGEADALEPTYLQLFLLKYMCPRRHCFGTLAPAAVGTDVHVCNVCGGQRTEAEFMAELEK